MKRFVLLMLLLAFSLPVGFSIAGCAGSNPNNYCVSNGAGYGLKLGQPAFIDLEPQTTGVSLAYGQTAQAQQPSAFDCKHNSASVSVYTWGTNNLNMVDVSPTGQLCGGTWNRLSPGGIADYTICTPPTAAAIAQGCPGGTPYICKLTASGAGVTSNAINIYIHPPISSIELSVAPPAGVTVPQGQNYTGCFSQNETSQLNAEAFVKGNTATPFCAPAGNSFGVPDCSTSLGHFTYSVVTGSTTGAQTGTGNSIVSIDPSTAIATAHLPGITSITASISNVSSLNGSFSTCPPETIQLQIPGTISSNPVSGSVTQGTPVPLNTIITDTHGRQITGVTLDYSSTNPQEISVGTSGSVSTSFPSTAAITAICNPSTCNPAIITQLGANGNGLPIVSNNVQITSTGRISNYLWMASPQSQFFATADLSSGNIGSPIKLPYTPNSMVLDQNGANLYFGNYRELMVVSAVNGSVSKEVTNVPGVVLGVSPNSSVVVIADQLRQVIYLYTPATGAAISIGGLGTRAAFSPDGRSIYVAGPDANYIYNANTGWNVYPNAFPPTAAACDITKLDNLGSSPFCSPDVTVTTPSVAAFFSGTQTAARSFCYNNASNPPAYPAAGVVPVATDHLTTTTDGKHILGASAATASLVDIALVDNTVAPPTPGVHTGACPAVDAAPLTIGNVPSAPIALGVTPTAIDQVVASPDSSTAFVTYTLANGAAPALLPAYKPATGVLTPVPLVTAAPVGGTTYPAPTAPVAGVFSPDNTTFFVGTATDNLVHFIDVPTLTDKKAIDPALKDPQGNPVPVQFLAVKPRPLT